MPGLRAMAGVWPCLFLGLVMSRGSLGLEIVSSHSRNGPVNPSGVRGIDAATQAATYHDRSPYLRRVESSYRESNNFGEHLLENTGKVVAGEYKHDKKRPAIDTSFQYLKTIYASPQSKLQKMQQQFEERKKSTHTSVPEQSETEVPTYGPLKILREIKASVPLISNLATNDTKSFNFVSESFNIHSLFKNIEINPRDKVEEDVQSEPVPKSTNRSPKEESRYDHRTGSEWSTFTNNADQQRSESNLMSKLQGTLTDFIDRTVNYFHPTRSGNGYYYDDASFHERSRKIDSGSFRQTLLEYFQKSKPEKLSALENLQLEKNNDIENSSIEKVPIVQKLNEFEKHLILNESTARTINNLGEFVPTSWSEIDDVQIKPDDETVFPTSTGLNELNINHEIQLETEMDSLSGFVNSTITQEILDTIQPVLSDAFEHSNFTEDELLNLLEDPDRLRQTLIEKTTDDHALGLLKVFQHYKGLSTYEFLQNMTQLDPSKLSQYVQGLASEVRDSLHKTWGLGTIFGTGMQEVTHPRVEQDVTHPRVAYDVTHPRVAHDVTHPRVAHNVTHVVTHPRVAHDSHYSESAIYPTYSDTMQRPPPEFTSPQRAGYPNDFPHLGRNEDAQSRTGSINISNPLFNFSYVAPTVAFSNINLTQKLNSTGALATLPLLAVLAKSSIIGLGALLALLIGSHYHKYVKDYGSEPSYFLVSPKPGYNSEMYAHKKLIMALPDKGNKHDEYHRLSSAKTVQFPKDISNKNVKTYLTPLKRSPGSYKKPPPSSYHTKQPSYRSDKHDSSDQDYYDEFGIPLIEYFLDERRDRIDHPGKKDQFHYGGHKDAGYDSRQHGRSSHRSSYEAVLDSSILFLDSSDEYYRKRRKPSRDRYYERSSERDRSRRKPHSVESFERSRESSRSMSKRPDRYRNPSRESKREAYASREKRKPVSRLFLSRENDRQRRRRPQSLRRQRGHSYHSSEPEYRSTVLVGDVLPANMAASGDSFLTPPLSMKVELGVPYFEDDSKPRRSFRSSDMWMSNHDQTPSRSWQDAEYGDNIAQYGSPSSSLAHSPEYESFRGRSEPSRRPKNTAASPATKWALEPSSHRSYSPHGSEAHPEDLVVWSDHPLPTAWSKESTRRDLTLPSFEHLPIKDTSPISDDYDVLGNTDGDTNYPEHQLRKSKNDTRRTLNKLLNKYRAYTNKF